MKRRDDEKSLPKRHRIRAAAEPLPDTGERCTFAGDGEVEVEHLHRYLFALEFCAGKTVVDVACGEGYGAALLGTVASRVIGVDASEETIRHAAANYSSSSVEFHTSDATELPLGTDEVDVVVSFETIEHLGAQEAFLDEVVRVLRPDGLLVLSTPERVAYATIAPDNPFHVRELSQQELARLLESRFRHVAIGGQQSGVGSSIAWADPPAAAAPVFVERVERFEFERHESIAEPVYLVALASREPLPPLALTQLHDGGLLGRLHASYRQELERLWNEVGLRDERLERATRDVDARSTELARERESVVGLRNELDERASELRRVTAEHARARADFEQRARLIDELESQLADLRQHAADVEEQRDVVRGELRATLNSVSWRVTAPLRWTKRLTARGRHPLKRAPSGHEAELPAGDPIHSLESARRRPLLLALPGEDSVPEDVRDEHIVVQAEHWVTRSTALGEIQRLAYRPLVSVVVPTFETPTDCLKQAIGSLLTQSYGRWEACIVDDGSRSPELDALLDEVQTWDKRIRVHRRRTNGGISAATNDGLGMARGDFVGFLDHDDELAPDALIEVVRALNADSRPDVVYTDQSYIEADGSTSDQLLKPDWSPTLFCGVMYVGHLLVVRRSLALELGFDSSFDNVQDFEFMLRVSERTSHIEHVPRVLYRWRRIPGSVAHKGDAKPNIEALQRKAVSAHLGRRGIAAVAIPNQIHAHRARLAPTLDPDRYRVAALVVGDDAAKFQRTVESLRRHEQDAEIKIAQFSDASRIASASTRRSLELAEAISRLDAAHILVLEAGLALTRDSLKHLVLHASVDESGISAPVVVGVSGAVEEAGRIISPEGFLPALSGWDPDSDGFAGSLSCAREVSGVSGVCALIPRRLLVDTGGVSPFYATVRYAVLDLSLRASDRGLRNVVTPECRVVRDDAAPSETQFHALDRELLLETWSELLERPDPFHNPGFDWSDGGYRPRGERLLGVHAR